jgi:hypothetical protein
MDVPAKSTPATASASTGQRAPAPAHSPGPASGSRVSIAGVNSARGVVPASSSPATVARETAVAAAGAVPVRAAQTARAVSQPPTSRAPRVRAKAGSEGGGGAGAASDSGPRKSRAWKAPRAAFCSWGVPHRARQRDAATSAGAAPVTAERSTPAARAVAAPARAARPRPSRLRAGRAPSAGGTNAPSRPSADPPRASRRRAMAARPAAPARSASPGRTSPASASRQGAKASQAAQTARANRRGPPKATVPTYAARPESPRLRASTRYVWGAGGTRAWRAPKTA